MTASMITGIAAAKTTASLDAQKAQETQKEQDVCGHTKLATQPSQWRQWEHRHRWEQKEQEQQEQQEQQAYWQQCRLFRPCRSSMQHRLFVEKEEHRFSCAHMTLFPDGTKERLHGHNYQVAVAIGWENELGFFDLSCLKAALANLCIELREHLLMPARSPKVIVLDSDEHSTDMLVCHKRYVIPTEDVLWLPVENIVVEALAAYVWERLDKELHDDLITAGVDSMMVTVTEASGQGASYESSPGVR